MDSALPTTQTQNFLIPAQARPRHSNHHRQKPHREILRNSPITHDNPSRRWICGRIKVHPEDFGMISYDPGLQQHGFVHQPISLIFDGDKKGSCVYPGLSDRGAGGEIHVISRDPHTCFAWGTCRRRHN